MADFVHGVDGLGNTFPSPPKGKAVGQGAVEFMLSQTAALPGEITVMALGPLTNVAQVGPHNAVPICAKKCFKKNVETTKVLKIDTPGIV